MDPLSLLARLAASVPPPRFHTVRYAGVLAPHSKWRSLVVPPPPLGPPAPGSHALPPATPSTHRCRYRPWQELLRRCFQIDVETCSRCGGKMRLIALSRTPRASPGTSRIWVRRPRCRRLPPPVVPPFGTSPPGKIRGAADGRHPTALERIMIPIASSSRSTRANPGAPSAPDSQVSFPPLTTTEAFVPLTDRVCAAGGAGASAWFRAGCWSDCLPRC
jgi:hypothetical protein